MSVWDKLTFWKKKEEPGLGLGGLPPLPEEPGLGTDIGLPEFGTPRYGPQQPTYPQPDIRPPPLTPVTPMQYAQASSFAPVQQQGDMIHKDIEIISAKLDAIKANLDSINQRLANIERIAYGEQERQPYVRRQW